jgi:hypothetical protein
MPINKPPSQHFSRLCMSSEYVARRIVDLARHPRCSLVFPWFYRPLFGSNSFSPDFWMESWPPLFPVKVNNLED